MKTLYDYFLRKNGVEPASDPQPDSAHKPVEFDRSLADCEKVSELEAAQANLERTQGDLRQIEAARRELELFAAGFAAGRKP